MAGGVAEKQVIEVDVVARSEGVDAAITKAGQYGAALDKLGTSQERQAASSDKGNAAAARAAQARASAEAAAARYQRQIDAESKALGMMQAAQDAATASAGGLTAAQQRAAQTAAAVQKAANDNAAAVQQQGEAFRAAGKFIAEHPVLVLGASVAAARALSGLATSAAGSLGAASASTAAFAEGASGMGAAVVAGATLASRGLAGLSTGATAAAAGLGAYADKVAGMTTVTGLLSRGLSLVPPLFLPIAAAFAVFEAGSAVIGKANADLDRLIALGERAEKLDLSAGFTKAFDSLAPKIRATADEMQAALKQASSFVQDRAGQPNALVSAISKDYSAGLYGASKPASMDAAEVATTTEARIKAALAAMVDLDEAGQHLAALDLGSKVFGNDLIERLRTGQESIRQFSDDLQAAAEKQVLDQAQVDRAVALNRAIADTKQGISDALAVNLDFSAAAIVLNEAWLKVLQAVRWVLETINDGIAAVGNFASAVASGIGGAFDAVRAKATGLLSQLGVISAAQKAAEVQGPIDSSYGPQQPTITARQFNEVFGPAAPAMQKAAAAAKQSQAAAQEAVSAYDNLLQKTRDRIEELDLETASVGKDTDAVIRLKLAHDLERAAKRDGITVTQQMRDETDRLGISLAASTDNLAKAKRGLELTRDAQRELADDFGTFADSVIVGGKKIGEAFADLSKTFASGSLKALLTGQGSFAGLFGTAGDKSGDLGGLLGGKLNFGGLFDSDKIASALGVGAEDGLGKAITGWLKEQKAGGGFMSSQLGQGLAAVGAGASIGYSSQSPLMGALGGGLAGLATGNPLLAVAGAGAGLLGGHIGDKPATKKDRENERRRRFR